MTNLSRLFLPTLIAAAAALAGCASVPANNATLDQAHSDMRALQSSPRARDLAAAELKQADEALVLADAAWTRRDSAASVENLAYLAKQRVALAREAADRKMAEAAVAEASAERDRMRLAARTREADTAQMNATLAQRDAMAAQRQAEASQRQSGVAQQQAAASQQQAAMSQQQAADAESRNRALEAQLRDLNAKKTERGMVVTIGDVLFDTGRSELKPGGLRNIEKLSGFLKEYPQRKAMIEGYTDSVGNDSLNQELSTRRADAVRSALVNMGVGSDRLSTQGFGQMRPVAGNDTSGGRQLNRRVEVVLSDDAGMIPAR